jgi:hypothetical protein
MCAVQLSRMRCKLFQEVCGEYCREYSTWLNSPLEWEPVQTELFAELQLELPDVDIQFAVSR